MMRSPEEVTMDVRNVAEVEPEVEHNFCFAVGVKDAPPIDSTTH